ncbi:hypothetical protein [Cytobacillus oceanisediminis]|uniref:Uncharacterized protein n=1 Tax=Cytobacillus oceanisediminis TaxID=665099 RepID=A0ABX3CKI8_9BACI|nr:hypothetical protein [Cytobacillus oceanisediminis]OHX41331.1 hypothetical protein BBV17_28445 [Cytobacillus oceanisediminis]
MDFNQLKNSAKEAIKGYSKSLYQSNSPFEVQVKLGIDASKTKPYYVETSFNFGDQIFKKRMAAVLKEEKYLLVYEFKQENEGSFLKPIYKTNIQMHMTKQVISTSDAYILESITLGLIDTHLTKDGVLKIKSLKKRRDYFKTEIEGELFAERIASTFNEFLKNQYDEYIKIKNNT